MTHGITLPPQAGQRAADGPPPVPQNTERKYLPEVQGLRALAVLMVVAYHVWFGRISGGVDIFLLISAFLLTGQFTRKLEAGRALELLKYWVHLFKRLLPMITVTLLATLGATRLFLPELRWEGIFSQSWASLFYYQNWFLAGESVDYYAAQHSVASPLQHFWSLSIQGQIFILWPLLFAFAALVARVARLRIRTVLIALFGSLFAVSFTFSVITTANNQAFAYFDTRTRLWEFALGSLLALLLPYLKFGRGLRIVLGWLGLVAMLACGIVLQVDQQFPGYMALWPTLAAAAIIVAGFTGSRIGADRLLSWQPLVKLGDSSYALYLFHWPVLVVYLVASGNEQAGLVPGLLIVLGSVAAAAIATKYIDTPIRRSPWIEVKRRRALGVILVCVTLVAVPLAGWQTQVKNANEAAMTLAAQNSPGAASLLPGYVDGADPRAPLMPTQASLPDDWPVFVGGKCRSDGKELLNICRNSIEDGDKHVVVLGSSHAHVLNTPILDMAERNHWSVTSITKGYCPLGDDLETGISESCADFNRDTMAEVLAMAPDLVVTTSTRTNVLWEEPELLDDSWLNAMVTLNSAGIDVVAVRDTPRIPQKVPECLVETPGNYLACGAKRIDLYSEVPPTDEIAWMLPRTTFLDFTDYFCDDTNCPAVIGNVIVYKDDNHVTRSYMNTLTPMFEREFQDATGWDMLLAPMR
ncbi:acyltransferase [Arthrobacter sp. PAMC 25486]|uniref:acyltransferase family protein n=1 Tax=Arthrobacter sp. PAMC 25486 TaxID=1494608 RepID=UPI0005363ECC|nr:acyltransferase family protein [Arthrobacter sp. PAMC 25486]AIY01276.1 acyltransferase [Arthrobacter sp. PAMC 25486]